MKPLLFLSLSLAGCGGAGLAIPGPLIPLDLYFANCTESPAYLEARVSVGDAPRGPGEALGMKVEPSSSWVSVPGAAHGFWWEAVRVEAGGDGEESSLAITLEGPRSFCQVEWGPPAVVTECGQGQPVASPCATP